MIFKNKDKIETCKPVFPLRILFLSQFDIKLKELAQNTKCVQHTGGVQGPALGFPRFGGTWRPMLSTVLTHQC